ncbi:MAG: hypothetical protein HY552_04500 [Elusimicrobia bacterium]|nr:hypothetical protein [Elusimicrobiota bacterium]
MNKHSPADKAARQTAILEAVAREEIATQDGLARALRRRGIAATQVSISRDVAELGLAKAGGVYRTATDGAGAADPELPLRAFVRRADAAGPHLVVVRCGEGTAARVAYVLDNLTMPGLVGTLAGDDTVFVAVDSAAAQKRLLDFLRARMKPS